MPFGQNWLDGESSAGVQGLIGFLPKTWTVVEEIVDLPARFSEAVRPMYGHPKTAAGPISRSAGALLLQPRSTATAQSANKTTADAAKAFIHIANSPIHRHSH